MPKAKRKHAPGSVSSEYTTNSGVNRSVLQEASGRVCGFLNELLEKGKFSRETAEQETRTVYLLWCPNIHPLYAVPRPTSGPHYNTNQAREFMLPALPQYLKLWHLEGGLEDQGWYEEKGMEISTTNRAVGKQQANEKTLRYAKHAADLHIRSERSTWTTVIMVVLLGWHGGH